MLSRVVGLSASGLLGLRPRSVLKTGLWLQNDPWRSSVLGTNRQAAISTSTKRKIQNVPLTRIGQWDVYLYFLAALLDVADMSSGLVI